MAATLLQLVTVYPSFAAFVRSPALDRAARCFIFPGSHEESSQGGHPSRGTVVHGRTPGEGMWVFSRSTDAAGAG